MKQCEVLLNQSFKSKESYTAVCNFLTELLQSASGSSAAVSTLTTASVVNPLTFKTSITLLPLIMCAVWNDAGAAMAACGKAAHAQQQLDAAAAVCPSLIASLRQWDAACEGDVTMTGNVCDAGAVAAVTIGHALSCVALNAAQHRAAMIGPLNVFEALNVDMCAVLLPQRVLVTCDAGTKAASRCCCLLCPQTASRPFLWVAPQPRRHPALRMSFTML